MFKTFRRYYWVTQGFLSRHYSIILKTSLIFLGLIVTLFLFARYLPTPKTTTRIARVGKYTLENFPLDIQVLLSTGLVSLDSNGDVQPALATNWNVLEDNTLYQFDIDPAAQWHGGDPVTADDINYNFKDVTVTRDHNTISFKLQEPFSPFFAAVSRPLLKNLRQGVGNYRLTHSKVGNGVLQLLQLENATQRLIYKFYPTESSALTAYKLGEVDQVSGLSQIPPSISNDPTTEVSGDVSQEFRQSVLFFNNNDAFLSSKSTRQALAYAVPHQAFGRERTLSPIDRSSWAYNSLVKSYDFDATKAKSLFAQDNASSTNAQLEIKTILPYLDIAEQIADSWEQVLGIQVSVKVVSSIPDDFQVILIDFVAPLDPDQYTIWHSTQPTNFTHYSNLKVDKLLEDGRRTSDKKLRKEIYQDFQRFLLEDCPAVFLFKSSNYMLTRKTIF